MPTYNIIIPYLWGFLVFYVRSRDIAVAVEDFINNHKKLNIDEFKEEFEMIKEVLVKRVNFEEKALYDIYVNNYKISNVLNKLSNV